MYSDKLAMTGGSASPLAPVVVESLARLLPCWTEGPPPSCGGRAHPQEPLRPLRRPERAHQPPEDRMKGFNPERRMLFFMRLIAAIFLAMYVRAVLAN